MISEECLLLYRCTRNTTISTSASNLGSSGRVDGPLLETRSLLTCHQPRGSQVLSTQRYFRAPWLMACFKRNTSTFNIVSVYLYVNEIKLSDSDNVKCLKMLNSGYSKEINFLKII